MNTLCSEGFLRFFNAMQVDSVSTDDILNLIPDALINIADEIHLGKFEVRVELPSISQGLSEYNTLRVLYDAPEGHDYMSHSRILRNQDKGTFSFAAFPIKGYSFSPEDKSSLDFLIKSIHSLVVKTTLAEQLNRRQFTDYMTGLPNNAFFMKFSNNLSMRGNLNNYTLIFSNLKNFNYINQQYGSQVGDVVLKEYSLKLLGFYGKDEVIARFGGDNFVALIKKENVEKYLKLISMIGINAATGNQIRTLTIHSRSGVYPIPSPSTNIRDAISCANASLAYAKKVADSDCVWFREDILERINHDREIISYFRTALTHKEYLVFYQPKVSLLNNHIEGCEALVRWRRGDKILPPGMFVPVLEDEGLICDLDFYVLERVCEDIRNWQRKGITPARVSVNFSKHNLRNPRLIDDVISVISKYRINPEYLEVELTESATSDDFEALTKFVDELKKHGIRTSIDDFGTGYSSLSLIKDLNVDVIKIDKSFIDNITHPNSKDLIILRSILSMVTGLGNDVIAEGCETVEQARILLDLGCHMIQGYLFDKPLSHDEYTDKLAGDYVYDINV